MNLRYVNTHFFLRESIHAITGGGAEGKGDTESQPGSMLSAQPDAGLDPTTLRS